MSVELRHWRAFAAAAATAHFGLAAEQLGISQSALSQLIKTLEQHLGAKLFDRSRQRVHLTETGRILLPEAQAMVSQSHRAEQAGRAAGRRGSRTIAVGYTGSVVVHPRFAALTGAIAQIRPAIMLRLDQCPVSDQPRLVAERQLDVGILRSPLPGADASVAFLALAADHMVAALPAAHPLAGGTGPLALAALAGEGFIQFRLQTSGGLNRLIDSACKAAGFEPRIAQTVPQIATMLPLVSAGLGVALVPASAARFGLPGVVYRDLNVRLAADLHIMYRRSDTAPALRELLLAVRQLDK